MAAMNNRLLRPRASGSALHPEAADWAARVTTNGGSASTNTLAAVSTFCAAIDAAGIRGRFYRLNLLCGNSDANLNAVRTPLYLAEGPTASVRGNTMDTNVSFSQGNYDAASGLIGNASNRMLRTGIIADTLSSADVHIGGWVHTADTTNGFRAIMGTNTANEIQLFNSFGNGRAQYKNIGPNFSGGASSQNATGLLLASTTSLTTHNIYVNSSSVAFNTVSSSGTLSAVEVGVFAAWTGSNGNWFTDARLSAYTLGLGLSGAQVTSYYNAMLAFMQTLGRA